MYANPSIVLLKPGEEQMVLASYGKKKKLLIRMDGDNAADSWRRPIQNALSTNQGTYMNRNGRNNNLPERTRYPAPSMPPPAPQQQRSASGWTQQYSTTSQPTYETQIQPPPPQPLSNTNIWQMPTTETMQKQDCQTTEGGTVTAPDESEMWQPISVAGVANQNELQQNQKSTNKFYDKFRPKKSKSKGNGNNNGKGKGKRSRRHH